jgi:hypothetical protein
LSKRLAATSESPDQTLAKYLVSLKQPTKTLR